MRVYAFVFARGGSKGLPGKNIKKLSGVPLVAYSIRLAHEIADVAGIFVSTDCEQIAAVAEEYGALIIERPADLATDQASEWMAWKHAVSFVQNTGRNFDVFLSLPATSPLRALKDVELCLRTLDDETDAVITVTQSVRNPCFNMVTRESDGTSRVVLGSNQPIRRQDAPQYFDITTVAYVTRPAFILSNNGIFDGRVRSVVVPKERSVDIDDALDFRIAEALLRA